MRPALFLVNEAVLGIDRHILEEVYDQVSVKILIFFAKFCRYMIPAQPVIRPGLFGVFTARVISAERIMGRVCFPRVYCLRRAAMGGSGAKNEVTEAEIRVLVKLVK